MINRNAGIESFEEAMRFINAEEIIPGDTARDALYEVLNSPTEVRDTALGSLLMGAVNSANPETINGLLDGVSKFEGYDITGVFEAPETINESMVVGCAGSGKKGMKTANITTPSMIVATAVGANTVKSGSTSTSSLTGSTDILELAGMAIPRDVKASNSIFAETGFGFYSIEDMIPNFDRMYGGRFLTPHALSFALPAVLLPIKTGKILYGYAGPNTELATASIAAATGADNVMTVSNTRDGVRYIDELASIGTSILSGSINGSEIREVRHNMADYYNLGDQEKPDLTTSETEQGQLDLFMDVLSSNMPNSIIENTVLINAATIIYLAEVSETPTEGFDLAKQALREGAAMDKLDRIISSSQRASEKQND